MAHVSTAVQKAFLVDYGKNTSKRASTTSPVRAAAHHTGAGKGQNVLLHRFPVLTDVAVLLALGVGVAKVSEKGKLIQCH